MKFLSNTNFDEYVDLTVLSIVQNDVTFDHNLTQ